MSVLPLPKLHETVQTTAVGCFVQITYRNFVENRRKRKSSRLFAARKKLRTAFIELFSG